MPKIIINHPDGTQVKYGLNGKVFTLGRAENNDIVLRDGASSSYHAVLKQTDSGDFAVTDLESTNHTRVNGQKVATILLTNGDIIQFGDTQAVYESDVVRPLSVDQPTQIYDQPVMAQATPSSVAVSAAPAAAGRAAAGAPAQPYLIQRPVSTMGGRRRGGGQGDGCFAILVLCVLLPFMFLLGLAIRHYHETKGGLIWDFARQYFYGT